MPCVNKIIEYIYEYYDFNEIDLSNIIYIMFNEKYRTDINEQWYELNKEGKWIIIEFSEVKYEILNSLYSMIFNCINHIKSSNYIINPNLSDNNRKYNSILYILSEKRQLLRDKNKIDQAHLISERINQLLDISMNISKEKLNIEKLNIIYIIRKIKSQAFIKNVMKDIPLLFYNPID